MMCIATLICIAFDILTGILKALHSGSLNSTVLRKGLYHKLAEIIALGGSWLLTYGCEYINFPIDLPVLNIVAVYICVMEIVSCIENLAILNPKLMELFKPYLQKLKQLTESEKEDK